MRVQRLGGRKYSCRRLFAAQLILPPILYKIAALDPIGSGAAHFLLIANPARPSASRRLGNGLNLPTAALEPAAVFRGVIHFCFRSGADVHHLVVFKASAFGGLSSRARHSQDAKRAGRKHGADCEFDSFHIEVLSVY